MTHWTRLSLSTRRQFLALAGLAGASTVIGASPFPRRLLDAGEGNHWVGVHLKGTACNRDAIGATVRIFHDGTFQTRMVKTGSSYLSQSELPVTFGVGRRDRVDRVVVAWPSGRVEEFKNIEAGRAYDCVDGRGLTPQK